MRHLVLILAAFAVLAVAAGSWSVHELEDALLIPADLASVERTMVVAPGAEMGSVVRRLAEADLFARPGWVRFYADHLQEAATPVPGEYALSRDLSALQQIERVLEGAVVTYTVILTPGVTADEVAERLAGAGVADADALRPLLTDRGFLDGVGISAESVEGYLFPDPYMLPKGLSGRALLTRLVRRYRDIVAVPELEPDAHDVLTEHQRLVLASLVQKSGVLRSEWRRFAALLRNRLRAGLPLDVSAADAYGRGRTAAHEKNRWSTRRPGLPSTPVCSPGIDAIAAVVHPARSDARYMVARENGTHVFCEDQACYRAAIRRWQRGLPPVPPGVFLGPDGLPRPLPPERRRVEASVGPDTPNAGSGGRPLLPGLDPVGEVEPRWPSPRLREGRREPDRGLPVAPPASGGRPAEDRPTGQTPGMPAPRGPRPARELRPPAPDPPNPPNPPNGVPAQVIHAPFPAVFRVAGVRIS